jgi:hypothetical protein
LVYCGIIGSATRRSYGLIGEIYVEDIGIVLIVSLLYEGEKVKLAYRLAENAAGRILVDKDTYKSLAFDDKKHLIPAEEVIIKVLSFVAQSHSSYKGVCFFHLSFHCLFAV